MVYEVNLSGGAAKPNWPKSDSSLNVLIGRGERHELPVLERTNMLVTGVVGTGKTCFTKAYLHELLRSSPSLPAVFFEIKKEDYMAEFYEDGDKVITYDPNFDGGTVFRWNMIKELRQAKDQAAELDELTNALFQDLIEKAQQNLVWANAARVTFKAYLSTILNCFHDDPSNDIVLARLKRMTHLELMEFLAKYAPNLPMLKDNFNYEPGKKDYELPRKGHDAMFFMQYVVEKFSGSFIAKGEDTIYDFLHWKHGKHLFIVHDFRAAESMSMFERYFLRKIITEKLSCTSDVYGEPLLLALDEVDKIGSDFGIFNAVTLGRQFGLQLILSTQSIENFYNVAPDRNGEHITNASLSGFPILAAFRPGDDVTIEKLQTLFGSCDRKKMALGLSRGDKPIVQIVTEPKVTDSMFQSLGLGECYIKVLNSDPVRCKIELNT